MPVITPLLHAAALVLSLALPVADAPLAGLACMLANNGEGSAAVYDGPASRQVVNRSMPIVLAVIGAGGVPATAGTRVHIRTPSNHDGWVEARLLSPYPGCTPVLLHDPDGLPLLGFR